jgi:TolB-like protein/tetratricopeptide (TPR) repeat protein
MTPGHFFRELQRRHVLRVIGAYAFAAWIAVEVYTTIQPILFETAEWSNRFVVIMALVGFPVTFILAWVFDITPQGVKRTASLPEPGLDGATSGQSGSGSGPASTLTPATAHAGTSAAAASGRRHLSPRATGFFGLGVLVALVAFAAYAGYPPAGPETAPADAGTAAIRSVAVLPFAGTAGEAAQDPLGDGIAEELLNRLTQLEDLKVPARTSSFAFRDRSTDVRSIGRELSVQAVIEGTVRREGDRVRVNVQLIDVATGYQLWSDMFEGESTSVFALQDEIADAIVDRLRLRFAAAPEAGERGTTNARAHELYLFGMQRWHQRTDRDLRAALNYFTNAVTEDPDFALAHAALAQTYAVLPVYGDFPIDTAVMRGSAAAARAIALDPSLAEAYAAMGQIVQNFEWDLRGAERYYQRALDYSNSVTAHQWYAETLMLLGRYDEAAGHVASVLARDPLSPVGLYVDAYLKTVRGRTDDGLGAWRELIRLHPDFELALLGHAYSAVAAGRADEAAGSLERLGRLEPARAALYDVVAAGIRDPSARGAGVAAVRADASLPFYERVAWLMALGDRAGALDEVERGARLQTDVNLPYLLAHPLLAPLHSEPRFRTIIDEIGIGAGG